MVEPTQTVDGPTTGAGERLILMARAAVQPVGKVYVITVEVAEVRPVTTPVADPMLAFVVTLLDHVPPNESSTSVIVAPTHTVAGPVIGAGRGLMTTVTLPVIVSWQDVAPLLATMKYVPGVVSEPNVKGAPVPGVEAMPVMLLYKL